MEARINFFRMLDVDLVLTILMCLNDPADLIRASAVSKSWLTFVISYGLCKELCIKTLPQLASITDIIEEGRKSNDTSEDAILQKEHRIYTSLLRALNSFRIEFCIARPISASSTDNFPEESIINTKDPRDQILDRASYWSSKGHYDPEVPETLIYKMTTSFCLISEILIAPFQAMFQDGCPIYSSRFVRFRMGHAKSYDEILDRPVVASQENAEDKFVWTYTSETFPMAQESRLQSFKLPEPVLCIGGYLLIELLGRVQKQQSDGKYYICLSHVQAIGRKLTPAFCVYINLRDNTLILTHDAEQFNYALKDASGVDESPLNINLLPILPPQDVVRGNLQDYVEMIHPRPQRNTLDLPTANNVSLRDIEEFLEIIRNS